MKSRPTLRLLLALALLLPGCGGGGGGVTSPPAPVADGADAHLTGTLLVAFAPPSPSAAPAAAPAAFVPPAGTVADVGGVALTLDAQGAFSYRGRTLAAGTHLLTVTRDGALLIRHPVELRERRRTFLNLFADLRAGVAESVESSLDESDGVLAATTRIRQAPLGDGAPVETLRTRTFAAGELAAETMTRLAALVAEAVTEFNGRTTAVALAQPPSLPATADLSFADAVETLEIDATGIELDAGSSFPPRVVGHLPAGGAVDLAGRFTLRVADATVARVDGATLVGVAPGATTVVARGLGLESPPVTVTVRSLATRRVTLEPATLSPLVLDEVAYRVIAQRPDGSTAEVSAQALLTATPADGARFEGGKIVPLKPGPLTLTARYDGVLSEPRTLSVSNAPSGIRLLLSAASCPIGGSVTYQVLADWRDGTAVDITGQATIAVEGLKLVLEGTTLRGVIAGPTRITAEFEHHPAVDAEPILFAASEPFTVRASAVTGISLAFDRAEFFPGESSTATVTASWSDGTTSNVSALATLSASPAGLVSFQGRVATGLQPGVAQVTATYTLDAAASFTSPQVAVRVRENPVVSLLLEADEPFLPAGRRTPLRVLARRADGSEFDATATSTFESDAPCVTVGNGEAVAVSPGVARLTARIGEVASPPFQITVLAAVAESLTLAFTATSVPAGGAALLQQTREFAGYALEDILPRFHVTVRRSDGSTEDVTGAATLVLEEPVATRIGDALQGLRAGSTGVTATFDGLSSARTVFTVTDPLLVSLLLLPSAESVPAGLSATFVVTGSYSDESTADVTADCAFAFDAALVELTAGEIRARAPGDTLLAASLGDVTSPGYPFRVTPKVLVSLAWSMPITSLYVGMTANYALTGTYSDGSTEDLSQPGANIAYTYNGDFLSVGAGRIFARAAGTTSITASRDGVSSPGVPFTVTVPPSAPESIALQFPEGAQVALGLEIPVRVYVTYTDGAVLDLTAASEFSFDPAGPLERRLTETGVSLRAVTEGACDVRASCVGLVSAPAPVTVLPKRLVSLAATVTPASIILGETAQVAASGLYSDGSSADLTGLVAFLALPVAEAGLAGTLLAPTVSRDYLVSASLDGIVSPQVTLRVGPKAVREVTLSLAPSSAPLGRSITAAVNARFSDGSNEPVQPVLTLTAPETFLVAGNLLTARAVGSTQVKASYGGVESATFTITAEPAVLDSLALSATSLTLAKGREAQIEATGRYSDASVADLTDQVTVTIDDPAVASFTDGTVRALAQGSTVIRLSMPDLDPLPLAVTVGPPELDELDFAPAAEAGVQGMTVGFALTATYSDGTAVEVAEEAQWFATPAQAARIDAAERRIMLLAPGEFTLSASFGGKTTATRTFAVTALLAERIVVNRSSSSLDVLVLLSAAAECSVRYGTGAEPDLQTAAVSTGGIALFTLPALAADTEIKYVIVARPGLEPLTLDDGGSPFLARTARIGIGMNYLVTGRMLEGGVPVPGGIALVSMAGADPLAVRAETDGYWFVNLANLKRTDTGSPMPFAAGATLTVRKIFAPGSEATVSHTLTGTSPDQIP